MLYGNDKMYEKEGTCKIAVVDSSAYIQMNV